MLPLPPSPLVKLTCGPMQTMSWYTLSSRLEPVREEPYMVRPVTTAWYSPLEDTSTSTCMRGEEEELYMVRPSPPPGTAPWKTQAPPPA